MTEANLQPSWPSLPVQQHCIVFINRARSVHNSRENSCTFILLRLVQPAPVIVQRGLYTIGWKASCILTSVVKNALCCSYWLHSSTGYARNSRKNNYALWWHSMDSKPYVKLAKDASHWVSLIAGLEYGMERNGKCTQLQLTRVTRTVLQGWASYYVSRALISP